MDKEIELEYQQWTSLSNPERAYNLFNEMLDKDGKSSLKAIVAQCLASILKWNISDIPEDITKEKMFDLDLYRYQINEANRIRLKQNIEDDPYLRYLVQAIKYATRAE